MDRAGLALVSSLLLCSVGWAQPGGTTGNQPAPTRPITPLETKPVGRPADAPAPTATAPLNPTPPEGESGPKDPLVDEAIELFKKGEVQKTLDKLEEAAKKNDKLPPAKIMLARMFGNAGQGAQARAIFEQAAMENPDHPDVFLTFGNMALAENRFADAELWFKEGLASMNRMKWTPEQQRNIKMNCLNGAAQVAERRAQWELARDRLKEMLAMEPKNGIIRNRYAQALFMLEKRDEAANEMEQAAKDEPKLPPFSVSVAQLYMRIRNKPKAEEWFNYGIKLDPKSLPTKIAYASFLMDEDKLDQASRLLNEVVTQDPKSLEGRLLLAMVGRLKKDYDSAEKYLKVLLAEKPDDVGLKNQLALVLINSNDAQKKQQAGEMAEANLKAQPRNAEIASTYAWVLFKMGRKEESEKLFQQIFQLGNVTADTAYFYAHLLAERGKLDDAKRLLQSSLDSQGRFFNRAEARDWLKGLERRP